MVDSLVVLSADLMVVCLADLMVVCLADLMVYLMVDLMVYLMVELMVDLMVDLTVKLKAVCLAAYLAENWAEWRGSWSAESMVCCSVEPMASKTVEY
jgi:hypothetical protein